MSDVPLLEYAPRTLGAQRKLLLRGCVVLSVVVCVVAMWKLVGEVEDRVERYQQRRAFQHTFMAWPTRETLRFIADPNPDLSTYGGSGCFGITTPFQEEFDRLFGAGCQAYFVHARNTPNRDERLVIVANGRFSSLLQFDVLVMRESQIGDVNFKKRASVQTVPLQLDNSAQFRIYSGRPDPDDASRFTLRYTVGEFTPNRREGFIDGYLQDDETIRWSVRSGKMGVASSAGAGVNLQR